MGLGARAITLTPPQLQGHINIVSLMQESVAHVTKLMYIMYTEILQVIGSRVLTAGPWL